MFVNVGSRPGRKRAVIVPPMGTPQGRLTLATGTPVMTSSQSGQTTVYYTPYLGRTCPIWNGSAFVMTDLGGELSQTTTDTTKSPAAVGASANYDIFAWSDNAIKRATRGPAWSSQTSRGSGAGTTQLSLVNGILVNAVSITNGPAAGFGTYLGTIASNGSSQIDYLVGAASSPGTAAVIGVWNMYNRVAVRAVVRDTTGSWTYTSATWRQSNNSAGNRISVVCGMNEDVLFALFNQRQDMLTGTAAVYSGISLDSTTATPLIVAPTNGASARVLNSVAAMFVDLPGLGFHYLQAMEASDGSNANTFNLAGNSHQLALNWRA